ncbi:MAG: winged helix-turn-helix domain-containing protein [Proteobacteria bacterium]|nr:winged helix-turn-helix domain-containing protein [Pseudomonadota bacterium]
MASPPPFVGRGEEITALFNALQEAAAAVVRGPAGAGKTRLADELLKRSATGEAFSTAVQVRCEPGDRAVTVLARTERSMKLLPGSLAQVLRDEPRLVVVDDIHLLDDTEALRALSALVQTMEKSRARGRIVLSSRDEVPLRRDLSPFVLDLGGLDEAAARQLWHYLEETYGPTPQLTCDRALTLTRGMPLLLRREYARAVFGPKAWNVEDMADNGRRVLEAMAVLRLPATATAIVAVAGFSSGADPQADSPVQAAPSSVESEHGRGDRWGGMPAAIVALVSHQLVDPLDDGRFALHEVIRERVLPTMAASVRRAVEERATDLVASLGRGRPEAGKPAWQDSALGWLSPVERLREEVRHLLAAGEVAQARARILASHGDIAVKSSGGGELIGLIDAVRAARSTDEPELDAVQASIAARHGQVAEALEICQGSGPGGSFDGVDRAAVSYRCGDVAGAQRQLEGLLADDDANVRCRAAVLKAEIELSCGNPDTAESLAQGAFARDRASVAETVRARLHMALAAVEEHAGRISAARTALSRAAGSGHLDPDLVALIETRRSACLAREGRVSEAEAALAEAERTALEIDAVSVVDEIRRCRSLVAFRRGNALIATAALRELVAEHRQKGDEIGALRAEIDLAHVLVRRGELASAAELVSACSASVERRKLRGLAAEVRLIGALIDLAELRVNSAHIELEAVLSDRAASAEVRSCAALKLELVRASSGREGEPYQFDPAGEIADDIAIGHARAVAAVARGDSATALKEVRRVAVRAERAGRTADLADALALSARLQFARGDRAGASRAAVRVDREAKDCGLTSARAMALLVRAALAREEGNTDAATEHAREVSEIATAAGLPIERLIAAEALDALAGAKSASTAGGRNAAAATLSDVGIDFSDRILSDLGLASVRPFRVVGAGGAESFVVEANGDLLRLDQRSLAIDAVREVIVRSGDQIANLRRRSLLKRLLFLFAGSPGRIFSKEKIVQTVWQVEYHPLRHDAALFTNIMRIRRLLGKDGADLIRVSEDGYRFVPPKDYLYIENAHD